MPHSRVSGLQRGRAKQLRSAMTKAETLLWRQLKAHRLDGLGFRRQTPMGSYIVDFVSHTHKLIVEVDGESHEFQERIQHDERRDAWLMSRGYHVLRFSNEDVMKNLEGVVTAINNAACSSIPSLTLPRLAQQSCSVVRGDASADGAKPCP